MRPEFKDILSLEKARRKKILFLAPSMLGGGSEHFLTVLLQHIDRSRFLPILGLVQKEGPFVAKLPQDIEVRDLQAKRTRYSFWKIIKLIRETKPDIVFSTLGHLNIAIMISKYAMPAGIKFVARESNIPSINLKRSPFPHILPFLYRRLYPKFEKIVCQSQDMFEDLVTYFGISPVKLVTINNPVDVQTIHSQIQQNGGPVLPNGVFNILAAGKLMYQKGFDLLLQSVAIIKRTHFHLTILGHGPEEDNLKSLALELGLTKEVTFEGFVDNPYVYMNEADLFVLSSRYEGFPNVVLEAMACGTPVVAFQCPGGINEIIEDGVNGWKVEAGNIFAFAKAVEKEADTNWKRDMIRSSTEEKFDAKKIITEYERVFLDVLNEGGKGL